MNPSSFDFRLNCYVVNKALDTAFLALWSKSCRKPGYNSYHIKETGNCSGVNWTIPLQKCNLQAQLLFWSLKTIPSCEQSFIKLAPELFSDVTRKEQLTRAWIICCKLGLLLLLLLLFLFSIVWVASDSYPAKFLYFDKGGFLLVLCCFVFVNTTFYHAWKNSWPSTLEPPSVKRFQK